MLPTEYNLQAYTYQRLAAWIDSMTATPQSKGGAARAANLTSEERSDIAMRASQARWQRIAQAGLTPTATHQGLLRIGDMDVEVYRLIDGRRMISKASMATALNLKSASGNAFLRLMAGKNIRPYISEALWRSIQEPLNFRRSPLDLAHPLTVDGYEGTLLIDACFALIEISRAAGFAFSEQPLAIQAEIVVRSAAKLGILALIDGAVGFQDGEIYDYRRQFQKFTSGEWRQWESEFPDQFADMLYRLYGLRRWDASSNKHHQFFAMFTRKFIYHPLANSRGKILELPSGISSVVYANGGGRCELFQFLSEEVGMCAIRAHLWQVVGIGNASTNIKQFEKNFYRAFPEAVPLGWQCGVGHDDL